MLYRYVLAVHIISVISWMAGILYLIRLFVYHSAETEDVVKERFAVMENKLYKIITRPAAYMSVGFGLWMLYLNPALFSQGWMHVKLVLVFGLFGFTQWAGSAARKLQAGTDTRSERFYRILNEVPTLIMIAVVFLVILKPF